MKMKKDLIFAPALIVVGIVLCLLSLTGIVAHIAVSVVGIALLVAYTVTTKKSWKLPALEIAMRACYGIALISGIVVMNLHGIVAVGIIHKVTAALFLALLVLMTVYKLLVKEER